MPAVEALPVVEPLDPQLRKALPLVLQAVKAMYLSEAGALGKLPSEADADKPEYTVSDMMQMSGQERREALKSIGVSPNQMILFLRAVQHVCSAYVINVVHELKPAPGDFPLHPRVSSAAWSITSRESVFGRNIVLNSESKTQTGKPASPPPPPPPLTRGKNKDPVNGEDSRKNTGCIGIKNQGSTCYLNSLLQTLYHLGKFRRSIYRIPIEDADFKSTKKSIPLALQNLFYNLETSQTTAETTDLTNSFGWTAVDTFIQHDIHELCRILLDNLEEKLKKSGQPNIVTDLFGGELENYIDVPEIEYRSSRKEPILDLQVVVKDCRDIYESFDRLFETEILDGGNKYCLERDGTKSYHRAIRGISIVTAPPVLLLHLTRFDYDPIKGDMCKVLTRWDYYDVIDLQRYFAPTAATSGGASGGSSASSPSAAGSGKTRHCDPLDPLATGTDVSAEDLHMKYQLHSVLVHSGADARFGHYYCYTRVGDQWLKFNDETVSVATRQDVFGANFGGNTINYWGSETPKTANAYMLVYVRRSEAQAILSPPVSDDLPQLLQKLIQEAKAEEERQRQEQAEAHLFVKLWPTTVKDLRSDFQRLNLPYFIRPNQGDSMPSIRRRKTDTLEALQPDIASITGISVENQVLWSYDYRGLSYRIQKLIAPSQTVYDACLRQDYRTSHECILYVQDKSAEPWEGPNSSPDQLITFHKLYLPSKSCFFFLGPVAVGGGVAVHVNCLQAKVKEWVKRILEDPAAAQPTLTEDIQEELNKVANYQGDLTMLLEKDERSVAEPPVAPSSGEVYLWQIPLTEAEAANCDYPTVREFVHYLTHRVDVHIHLNQPPQFARQFTISLPDDASYTQVQKVIAKQLTAEARANQGSAERSRGGTNNASPAPESPTLSKPPSIAGAMDSIGSPPGAANDGARSPGSTKTSPGTDSPLADWKKILLAQHNPDNSAPYFQKPKKKSDPRLHQLLRPTQAGDRVTDILYFEIALYTVEELEDSNPLRFEYFTEKMKPMDVTYTILFPANVDLLVGDVLNRCAENLGLPADHPELRLVDVWKGKFYNIYDDATKKISEAFEQRSEYHIEYKPQPLPAVPPTDQGLVHISHFHRQNGQAAYHGDPFSIYIAKTDLIDDVMDRVALKLDLPNQAISSWKPAILVNKSIVELNPNTPVLQQMQSLRRSRSAEAEVNFSFGLEHAAMVGGRRGTKKQERGLRIYH